MKQVHLETENLERETGIEPATSSLGSWHSTTELLPLIRSNFSDSSTLYHFLKPPLPLLLNTR